MDLKELTYMELYKLYTRISLEMFVRMWWVVLIVIIVTGALVWWAND